MADTTVSNTVAERRAGSSPALGTKHGPGFDTGDVALNAGKGLETASKRPRKGNARTAAGPYGHLFRELSAGQLDRPEDTVTLFGPLAKYI
jgi:hypothetical protein